MGPYKFKDKTFCFIFFLKKVEDVSNKKLFKISQIRLKKHQLKDLINIKSIHKRKTKLYVTKFSEVCSEVQEDGGQ